MSEQEIRERREKIRVIITEVFMFFSAIALVVFLTLIVMGYNFSLKRIGTEEEVIQRSGLVQVSSRPTGAAILVDGNSTLLLRTNGSRTASAGEHEISLSREGYHAWKKTIKVTEGLMYRLNYPRLFPLERTEEEVLDLSGVSFYSASDGGERLVYLKNGRLFGVELNANKTSEKVLIEGVEFGTISQAMWSKNGERMLAKFDGKFGMVVFKAGKAEFLELAKYLGETSSGVKFETEAGDRILFLEGGELRELDLLSKSVNLVVTEKVATFDNVEDKIFYTTNEGGIKRFKVIRVGETEGVALTGFETKKAANAQVVVTEYFQEFYFGISGENEGKGYLDVFRFPKWPTMEEMDFSLVDPEQIEVFVGEISRSGELKKRGGGMVIVVDEKNTKTVFDIEAGDAKEFEVEGENGWVDEFLRFEVRDGEIWVVDYDGNNWIQVAEEGVEEKLVKISANNKYIYYIKAETLCRQHL